MEERTIELTQEQKDGFKNDFFALYSRMKHANAVPLGGFCEPFDTGDPAWPSFSAAVQELLNVHVHRVAAREEVGGVT